MTVRIGVLGAGRIGRRHVETLAACSDVEIVAVADPAEASARLLASRTTVPWTSDPGAVISDPRVDALVIATPTASHAELIRLGATERKHVFCEKPVALNLSDADDALRSASEAGVIVQVGYQRRFDPEYEAAHERIGRGDLGRLYLLRSTTRDPQPPPQNYSRSPFSIFTDTMSHDFDILRWLTDEEIVEVSAIGSSLLRPEHAARGVIDTTGVLIRFASGALGLIDNCWEAVYGYDVRTEVLGARGAIDIPVAGSARAQSDSSYQGSSPDQTAFFLERFVVAYEREIVDFVACVDSGRLPRVSGEDARETLRVSLAAAESVRERRPVLLSAT